MLSTKLPGVLLPAIVCVLAAPAVLAAEPVTFSSLLNEMTDLNRLTRMPDPAYVTRQYSSYDRRATDPKVQTDENWFANGDRGQHLRVEERNGAKEWVLADTDGPGAIVRFWSANPADGGIVRFYLDGSDTPAIEMSLAEYLGGEKSPAPKPISGERSRGWNSYLPIPYARHCKITTSEGDYYYAVDYRTYAPATAVETFQPESLQAADADLKGAASALAAPQDIVQNLGGTAIVQTIRMALAPGESGKLALPTGPHVAGALSLRVIADDLEAALRGCLFEVRYDGDAAPEIQAPLGDFFGTAPGPQPFQALPCGVLEDGTLYAHWPMPYRKAMVIMITNHGAAPVKIDGSIASAAAEVAPDRLYLHAKWRASRDLPTRPREDWNFATLNGRGRFAGVMLHVSNPVKAWWGEGDEKIYVDGETFPSFFGTGSEDYFGYAWCCNETFVHAYHNQPRCDGPGNYGQTCVSRFHIMDDIPFTQSFQFDMEVWHWADCKIGQSAMTWWYAAAGGTDNFIAPDPASLTIPAVPPLPAPKRVAGAIEGEKLKVVEVTGGKAQKQESDTWEWSNGAQLWWIDATPGDRMVVAVDVPEDGHYEVRAGFTRAPDYGIVTVSLGDNPTPLPLDLYWPGVEPTPEVSLGEVDWAKGSQTITFEIAGHNNQAVPRHMVGVDYIRLVKRVPAGN